jgi:hypothetical protein
VRRVCVCVVAGTLVGVDGWCGLVPRLVVSMFCFVMMMMHVNKDPFLSINQIHQHLTQGASPSSPLASFAATASW